MSDLQTALLFQKAGRARTGGHSGNQERGRMSPINGWNRFPIRIMKFEAGTRWRQTEGSKTISGKRKMEMEERPMKKLLVALFTLLMAVSLAACAGNSTSPGTDASDVEGTTDKNSVPENKENSGTAGGKADASGGEELSGSKEELSGSKEETDDSKEDTNDTQEGEVKILVAYFSATNTTEALAEYMADGLDADLYEIVPEEPYTDADLNYHDDDSRTSIEMNDPSARPAVSGSVENMEQYDYVFLGYPIWWGEAPKIVNTFLESYDFSGKTVVPFCTSGSSGIGSSAEHLQELASGAEWLSGQRFSGGTSRAEMIEWVNGLGLGLSAR